jgi:DNA-binding transcriptional MocR family regulator
MASPLTAAIATRWIEDGTANAALNAIRHEAKARQAIVAQMLPSGAVLTNQEGFHTWIRLSPPWTRGEFVSQLRAAGIGVVGSDAFALSSPPEAVRLGLGAAATRHELAHSLQVIADLLSHSPAMSTMVV